MLLYNIASIWTKTGLILFNSEMVLLKIAKPTIPRQVSKPKILITGRAIRRFYKNYLYSPIITKIMIFFNATERLAAEYSIAIYVIRGLKEAIKIEKYKYRCDSVGNRCQGPYYVITMH
jgi:hypothetical protein